MYCKNCGTEFPTDESLVCTTCGVRKGDGDRYCWNCGKELQEGSQYCMSCGVATATKQATLPGQKSKIVAGLLGIFLGAFGVHNFYLGYKNKAITQLALSIIGVLLSCIGIGAFLCGAVGIWGLVEGVLILVGTINVDGEGNPIGE